MLKTRLQRAAVLAVAVAALVIPATAGAWNWGYNYIGSGLNTPQVAGWSYWSYSSANKTSGGSVEQRWGHQEIVGGTAYCGHLAVGVTNYWSTPSDCGWGGYLYADWSYYAGDTSYIYMETN